MNPDYSDSMEASLLQLERELQSLTPAPPRRELIRSLQSRMEQGVSASHSNKVHAFPWRRMVTPAAAAAAAVAVMSFNSSRRPAATGGRSGVAGHEDAAPAIKWEPMPMRSEYRALLNAGWVFNENFEPVQDYLMNTVDHHEWRNAADNSSVRLTIPRQQRFVVPAAWNGGDTWSARRQMQFQ